MKIEETLKLMKKQIEKTKKELSVVEEQFENLLEKHFYTSLWKNIKKEEILSFVKKPYLVFPYREKEWRLYVPKFIPLEVGWLEFQTESFNVFRVNRWIEWLTPLPEVLKEELGIIKPEFKLNFDWEKSVLDIEEGDITKAKKKYGKFIYRQLNHSTFQIKKTQRFSFLVELLKEGILPYRPKPANPEDFHEKKRVNFELRDYQKDAWNMFLKYSHIGLFYPFGAGKTFLGLYALAQLKGKKLIVVPSLTLKEQWENRIKEFTQVDDSEYEITTYYSLHKYRNRNYDLICIDESHHSPADTFSLVFFIPRKYTINLSGSPYREDGRTELIFTLGYPIGADWNYFWKKGIVKRPTVRVIVVKSYEEKIFELDRLLKEKSITLIYSDSIRKGKRLANRYNAEFIYSQTKKRLELIEEALDKKGFVILSRVGDEGVSLPAIQRIIEFDFLFGCFDEKTEVLTEKGWKFFKDITFDDKIATLNSDGFIEFHNPIDVQKYYYNSPMIQFGGKNSPYDFLVTPEHRMFVRPDWKNKFIIKRAEELFNLTKGGIMHYELKKDAKWKGKNIEFFEIPIRFIRKKSPKSKSNPTKIPINPFLRFLGWYLSEGSCWGGNIQIAQTKKVNRKEIIKIIKEMGMKPHSTKDKIVFYCRPLARYLKKLGISKEKFIPSWVKELPPKKLEILISTMMKGDGHGITYYTSSKRLADDFQEVAIKCGYATTLFKRERKISGEFAKNYKHIEYSVTITKKSTTPEIEKKPKIIDYKGYIYDVTVPNGIILVRRNGKAVWSGNSRRQEAQRVGRLFHSTEEGEHYILMSLSEFNSYKKRLYSLLEKGIDVKVESKVE